MWSSRVVGRHAAYLKLTRQLRLYMLAACIASWAQAENEAPGVERSVVVKPIEPAAPGAPATPASSEPGAPASSEPGTPAPSKLPQAERAADAEAAAAAPGDETADPSSNIRVQWKFAIGGEFGWNSLAGLGINFVYHPIPYLALEAGAGLGLIGLKGGARLRVNFLTSAWTPILGVGYIFAPGTGDEEAPEADFGDGGPVTYKVRPSSFIQAVAGVNYTGPDRWVLTLTGGYAFLLRENLVYVEGSKETLEQVEPFVHGGIVVSAALGYAF